MLAGLQPAVLAGQPPQPIVVSDHPTTTATDGCMMWQPAAGQAAMTSETHRDQPIGRSHSPAKVDGMWQCIHCGANDNRLDINDCTGPQS
jgi:hypothetical protein